MPDLRPAGILAVYLLLISAVMAFAEYDKSVQGKGPKANQPDPSVRVEISSDDVATVGEVMTCEIKVSIGSAETTAAVINVSDTISFVDGASLEVIEANPGFEDTESVPGGGLKINWGLFRLMGGEELSINLKLKSEREGMVINRASAKLVSGRLVSSNNMMTRISPSSESALTTTTAFSIPSTTTAFNFGLPSSKKLPNSSLSQSGKLTWDNYPSTAVSKVPIPAITGKDKATTAITAGKPRLPATKPYKGPTSKKEENTPVDETATDFSDIKKGDWFGEYISDLKGWNIINGYPDKTFRPGSAVSRAEFVAFIMRVAGVAEGGPEPFADVARSDWFFPAVASAYNLGLIDGISEDMFAPPKDLSREQAAVISVKVAKIPLDMETDEIGGWLQGFSDRDKISDWARSSIAASIKYNLLKGYPNNEFSPQGSITRSETSALIYRLFFEKRSVLVEFPDNVEAPPASSRIDGPERQSMASETMTVE